MKSRNFSILAVAALVSLAACGGGADEGDVVEQDTTPIPGVDSIETTIAVPTTDSLVTTTTTETIEGEATDSTPADSVHP